MNSLETLSLTKGIPGQPCPIAKILDVIGTSGHF